MCSQRVPDQLQKAYSSGTGRPPLDPEKLQKLAVRYLPIVKSEVSRFKMRLPRHIEADDLHGVGISGMMRALERGNEEDPEIFGAYVRQRVRGAILDELRRADVLTRSVRKKAREYDQVVQGLEQRKGRAPTETEIRIALGLTEEAFGNLLEELRPISFLSIDDTASSEWGRVPIAERLEDPTADSTIDKVQFNELLFQLQERLDSLPQIQKKILHMYYFKDFSLAEIAKVFDLSESRICQMHTQAIRGLRVYLRKQMER